MSGRLACALALALLLPACASEPFCGQPADATGRLVAYCQSPREEPVCDEPGMMAHYEETPTGIRLVGGRRAICDERDELVCPVGTVGEPYCILDPEL